jgi:4'-phosphopantetheinyl transferase
VSQPLGRSSESSESAFRLMGLPESVSSPGWSEARSSPHFEPDEVHVWCIPLETTAGDLARLEATLSAGERARAARYRFGRDRERFVVRRGRLRLIIGASLGIAPDRLEIADGHPGRPVLTGIGSQDDWKFSQTHSAELSLLALARGRSVGVDLERVRPSRFDPALAGRFFSPSEQKALRDLPPWLGERAFFAAWTRKEAFLKARGEGLSMPLDGFSVSLDPRQPAEVLDCRGGEVERSRWSLCDLPVGPGWAAALAVEGAGWRLVLRQ